MDKEQLLLNLTEAVVQGNEDLAAESAKKALEAHLDPLDMVEQGLSKGMEQIGLQFEAGDCFLPELLMASQAFNAAMGLIKPELEAQKKNTTNSGTVVIGTVKGDMHSIGKNIVEILLETGGFEVIDLGVDNSALKFVQEAEKAGADMIALSCLMTTTMPAQREVINTLKELGLRAKYIVIIGGGPTNQGWADKIGADGYGASAIDAVRLAKDLINKKRGLAV
ncbi:MAG: corrinoid protein [Anaerolineaceae bacterium]|nr:corrinoid protein [Anaerolineaceae bacterium]